MHEDIVETQGTFPLLFVLIPGPSHRPTPTYLTMQFTTLFHALAILSLACSTFAISIAKKDDPSSKVTNKNFYLLAAPEKTVTSPNAIGLDLVDPFYVPDYSLRVQDDAAVYLQFNLTSFVPPPIYTMVDILMYRYIRRGVLSALSGLPHTGQPAIFKSNVDNTTGQVTFHQEQGTKGLFSFQGHFLAYKKDADGFTACDGELGNTIVSSYHAIFAILS
jgi:hypothetical protein